MGKVKAATLLETIVAMGIILIVFIISGVLFIRNAKSGDTAVKMKALNEINTCMGECNPGELPVERTIYYPSFRILLQAERSTEFPNMAKIKCSAIDSKNTILVEAKRLKVIR